MVTGYHMTPVHQSTVLISTEESNDEPLSDKFSLTSLWDYVIRMRCLPESLDIDTFFETIHQRLRSPEWEIRQNALRVLVDFMPLLQQQTLDEKLDGILGDIICNLGHLGPAVRKGAVDVLKTYLNLSGKPNAVIRNLVETCIEKNGENKMCTNVVLGVIISLPYIINNKLNDGTINYIIYQLLDKIVQVMHQETVLRSLVRIRALIGETKFDAALAGHKTCKNEFDLLCGVYDLHMMQLSNNEREDYGESISMDEDSDKVILETEIQLDSGSSIMMKIHEEGSSNASMSTPSSGGNNSRTFQVLPNVSIEEETHGSLKRTPRRVHFGGEIVKLRTPDSDSNFDENDATISIISDGDQPVIEINYTDGDKKTTTTRVNRSLIPIRISHTQSAPSSPTGKRSTKSFYKSKEFKSSPNLSKKSSPTWGQSRIPRRKFKELKTIKETTIDINIVENSKVKDQLKLPEIKNTKKASVEQHKNINKKVSQENKPKNNEPTKKRNLIINIPQKPKPAKRSEETFSPIPVHNEIELFHNLTRTPSPKGFQEFNDFKVIGQNSALKEEHKMDSVVVCPTEEQPKSSMSEPAFYKFNSLEGPMSHEVLADSPIPINNTGECLTCSSSGSETGPPLDRFHWLDASIVDDLQNMEDIKARERGFEELTRVLQKPGVLNSLEERLPSLLSILFPAIQQAALQTPSEQGLSTILGNMNQEILMEHLHKICLNLAKLRSPSGTKLALVLMERVPAKLVIDQILTDSIIGAKSAKVREGALQIVMTVVRLYPSTDLNITKTLRVVLKSLCDKKKRIRQAALETMAALAQVSGNSKVLEVANEVTSNLDAQERQQLLHVIRTRLSRKQLPHVNHNGKVQYSSAIGDTEIEWLLRGHSESSDTSSPHMTRPISTATKHFSDFELLQKEVQLPEDRNNNKTIRRHSEKNIAQRFIAPNGNERFIDNYSPRASTGEMTRTKKVNYWKSNARNQESESDWSSNQEESFDGQKGQRTQVWAIDPTAFATSGGKLSSANGTLRQVYVVQNTKEAKTTATNTDFQAESQRTSGLRRSLRGRSFSPPSSNRTNPQQHEGQSKQRFINSSQYYQNSEHLRKSFSSEHITPQANTSNSRFHKEQTYSSGSSTSSSSMRRNSWRDMRSGIPVPIYDQKPRIRTRSTGITKNGPMTIYYPSVKSPSPQSTPEKFIIPVANRQPFSSGSESSGYFTPPPDSRPEVIPTTPTPTHSVETTPKSEHFMRVETPRKLDSESESFDEIDAQDLNKTEVNFESKISSRPASSLSTAHHFGDRTLSKNENTNSLEFSKLNFNNPNREINVEITTQIHRKNVNSAPALNEVSFDSPARPSLPLPGDLGDSLDDTTQPDNLYISSSPEKRSPAKVIKTSIRRKSSKYASGKCSENCGDRPFTKPREAFHDICAQLESPEWELTMKGLAGLMRLIKHHRDVVENQMHAVCVLLGKHIRNLRSQVARNACLAATELFKVGRRALEMELDEVSTPLLQRTADTNKFLRSDANAALDEMCLHMSVPKLVSVITYRGCLHQNSVVRSASIRLLCNIVQRMGAEKVFQLPRDTRDKILLAGANSLTEGSLETRQHAKILLGLLSEHAHFYKAMTEAVPASILRHIDKTMKLLMK